MRNFLGCCLAVLALVAPATAQEAVSGGLPGGAQSLHEEHGDWTVSCRMEETAKLCVMSQTLADSQSGQPVLSIELTTSAVESAEGMLLLPFGLLLANGAMLSADGNAVGTARPFLTCIATGCLVPVQFGAGDISTLRSGTELTIAAQSASSGEALELKVSLAGFSRAQNRTVELSL